MNVVASNAGSDEAPLELEAASRHLDAGRLAEAEGSCRALLSARPDQPDALHLLGRITLAIGNPAIAEAFARRAIVGRVGEPAFHRTLGKILQAQGKLGDAMASYEHAIALDPGFAKAHLGLGTALRERGEVERAIASLRRAIELQPASAMAYLHLGLALQDHGDLAAAEAAFEQALAIEPDNALVHNNLAGLYLNQGRSAEAVAAFRRTTELAPELSEPYSNLLFALHYPAGIDREALLAEAKAWDERFAAPLAREMRPHPNDPDPERRLRIGYVSGDFHRHPVGYFLEAVVRSHDKSQVELFYYSNHRGFDDLSRRLVAAADHSRLLHGIRDELAAEAIRRDRIDILVDLSGHTGGHRLSLFARKPAPVQVSWLGYFDTTGLAAIDYVLLDRHLCPPGDERLYVERVVRLPETYLCYAPQTTAEVAPLPALANGHVTFACFNKAAKVTPEVVALWAAVLRAVPGARLCLKDTAYDDPGVRGRLARDFAAHDVGAERLSFLGRTPYAAHVRAYGEVDLALDPFPFNGGTTTVEALWMGVPVVTLAGDRFVSRMGVSHLSGVGLTELIGESEEEYLAKAVALARDLPRLAALRAGLRARVARSPLCDGPGFTRGLEAAYRRMWRAWCRGQGQQVLNDFTRTSRRAHPRLGPG